MTEVTVVNGVIGIDPATPDFVIAEAKNTAQVPLYWPGKDYPDREVWLKKRAAQREKAEPELIYSTARSERKSLSLGINQAKRMAAADAAKRGESTNPKKRRGCRQSIIVSRHGYYRDRYEGKRS